MYVGLDYIPGHFTGHDPTRRLHQEVIKISRVGRGRVRAHATVEMRQLFIGARHLKSSSLHPTKTKVQPDERYPGTTFFFCPWGSLFFSSRVTGDCPVITDLIMRVNVTTTTTTINRGIKRKNV